MRPHLFPQTLGAHSCELCHEVFKSKNVRALSCGHKFHKGVSVPGPPSACIQTMKYFGDKWVAIPPCCQALPVPCVTSLSVSRLVLWEGTGSWALAVRPELPVHPSLRAGHTGSTGQAGSDAEHRASSPAGSFLHMESDSRLSV